MTLMRSYVKMAVIWKYIMMYIYSLTSAISMSDIA
jgi:hypothetical protein